MLREPFRYRIRLIEKLCERAGVKKFGFHSIRHLSASMLDSQGVPLTTIQEILRHKDATTTNDNLRQLRGVKVNLNGIFDRRKLASRG